MIVAHDNVVITRCPPGPEPDDNSFDAHQFEGWRTMRGDGLDVVLERRLAGSDPLGSPARRY
jgi:hypothetical protein